jgi:iron complex outermembrane receptor protein
MFNLAYDWSPQLMVYTTYSEGFKGGGFHQRVFPPLPETPTFDPEYATSYEIGFKYANAANTFVLNGAGFYTDYEGMQVTVFTAIAPVVDNAGNGEISGFELETRWVPFSDWFVEASVGYLNTGYKSVDPTTGLTGDERLPRVPNWNLSASLTREFGLGELGTMTPRLDWSYRSSVEYDTFNTPFIEGDSYYLLNGNLSWKSVDSRYGLTLRAENLTGRHYYRQRVYQEGFGNILGFRDRGRQWMLTVAVSF